MFYYTEVTSVHTEFFKKWGNIVFGFCRQFFFFYYFFFCINVFLYYSDNCFLDSIRLLEIIKGDKIIDVANAAASYGKHTLIGEALISNNVGAASHADDLGAR